MKNFSPLPAVLLALAWPLSSPASAGRVTAMPQDPAPVTGEAAHEHGDVLLLRLRDVLQNSVSYDGLKRALTSGAERARAKASQTMTDVRKAMHLS